nr:lignin-forming anionic peroxidase-like [Tanacetum cinerariifolium]
MDMYPDCTVQDKWNSDKDDYWIWSLGNSIVFNVKDTRNLIDDSMLPDSSTPTRCTPSEAQLSTTFYDGTCPNALRTIRTSIRTAISRERRMAASILRLHFHDCFGCDASILLEDGPTIISENNALPNKGSVRGYEVIEAAKSEVEKLCPGVVSCTDILTIAARDASEMVGGPRAHTIGQAQCFLFRDRIYANGSDIDAGFPSTRRRRCPINEGNKNLAALDLVTPNSFDNNYFKNLIKERSS